MADDPIVSLRVQWFEGVFRRPHAWLERADQLPHIVGAPLAFGWDKYMTQGASSDPGRDDDEHGVFVLMHAGTVIWRELDDRWQSWPPEIERLLQERYGERFAQLQRVSYAGTRQGWPDAPWQ